MQRATLEHHFPFSFERLVEIREARYGHLDIWNMFSAAALLKEEDDGAIRLREYRLSIRTTLPIFAQKLLADGEGLACYDTTKLDRQNRRYTSDTRLRIVNSAVTFIEHSLYEPESFHSSRRIIDIEATVKIPAIGKPIERLIVQEFRAQSDVDRNRILEFASRIEPAN